jgi:hypothetical protein
LLATSANAPAERLIKTTNFCYAGYRYPPLPALLRDLMNNLFTITILLSLIEYQ